MIYTDITSRALSYLLKQPDLHIDMTEAIYRGVGELLYAEPDGVLTLVHTKSNGAPLLYQHSASTPEKAAQLLSKMTQSLPVVVHQDFSVTLATEQRKMNSSSCTQAVWPTFEPPRRYPGVEIWPLDLGDLPVVRAHYNLIQKPSELEERITSGNMFGACVEDQLAGFIGVHAEGAMGMLMVLPQYRGRGIGSALETYLIRRELRRGHIPYSQIFLDNQVSIALQKKVGMNLKPDTIWWLLPKEL